MAEQKIQIREKAPQNARNSCTPHLLSKRVNENAEGSEHHSEAEVGQDEDDAVDDDSHKEIIP